jgi:hypothetical protein
MPWLSWLDNRRLVTNDTLVSSLLCVSEKSFGKSGTETDSSSSTSSFPVQCLRQCPLLILLSIPDAKQSQKSTASLIDTRSQVWSFLSTCVFGGGRGGNRTVLSPEYLSNSLSVIIPFVTRINHFPSCGRTVGPLQTPLLTVLDTVFFQLYKNVPLTATEFWFQYYKVT